MSSMTNVKIEQLVEYEEQPDHSYIVSVMKNKETFTFACPQHVFEVLFTDNMFEPEIITESEELVENLPINSGGDLRNQTRPEQESESGVSHNPELVDTGLSSEGSS